MPTVAPSVHCTREMPRATQRASLAQGQPVPAYPHRHGVWLLAPEVHMCRMTHSGLQEGMYRFRPVVGTCTHRQVTLFLALYQ